MLRAPERRRVPALRRVLGLDRLRGPLDVRERLVVALLVVVGPRDEAVLAHHDGPDGRLRAADLLHRQAQLEARAHPGHVGHPAPEDLARQLLAAGARGDGDDRVGVHVVHVAARDEAVQRRVDGAGAGVQVERRVRVHAHHVVLGLGLEPIVRAGRVGALEADQPLLVQRREVLPRARAQVAARPLHPQHLHRLARQRVRGRQLRRRVAAAGVGDALVGPEAVRAINEPSHRVERRRLCVVPQVVHMPKRLGAHVRRVT